MYWLIPMQILDIILLNKYNIKLARSLWNVYLIVKLSHEVYVESSSSHFAQCAPDVR